MDDTNKAFCFFLAMAVPPALIEVFVLRYQSKRWSLPGCVASVAVFSGILGVIAWMLIDWGDNSAETEEPPDFIKILVVLMLFLFFTAISLIPTGVTVFLYRKLKRGLPN